MAETSAWFALRVMPRPEKKVVQALAANGFDAFVPLRNVRRQWSGRRKTVQEPISSGYVHRKFGSNQRFMVPGSIDIAGIDNAWAVGVPGPEIAVLRKLSAAEMDVSPMAYVTPGETATIDRGPLAGLEVCASKTVVWSSSSGASTVSGTRVRSQWSVRLNCFHATAIRCRPLQRLWRRRALR